jgi:hypothetical protein
MKKTLLSLTILGTFTTAYSQVLFQENFNSLNTGNLVTNLTGGSGGQNNWAAATSSANPLLTDYTVLNIGPGDNVFKITGSALPPAAGNVAPFEYQNAWHELDISTRTSGNNLITTTFKLFTDGTTNSLNRFDLNILDSDFYSKFGISYKPSTRHLYATAVKTISTIDPAPQNYIFDLGPNDTEFQRDRRSCLQF